MFTLLDSNHLIVALVMANLSSCSFADKHTNHFSLSPGLPLLLWRSLIRRSHSQECVCPCSTELRKSMAALPTCYHFLIICSVAVFVVLWWSWCSILLYSSRPSCGVSFRWSEQARWRSTARASHHLDLPKEWWDILNLNNFPRWLIKYSESGSESERAAPR